MSNVTTTINKNELINSLNNVDIFVMKKYLTNLTEFQIMPLDKELLDKDITDYIRLYKLDKIVFDNDENNQNKLATVYQSIHSLGASIINIIESDGKNVNYYIGIKSLNGSLNASKYILEKSFKGNFAGSELSNLKNPEILEICKRLEKFEGNKSISSCSVISGFKKKNNSDDSFIQGIEKLIESMKGEKYKIVVISDPIDSSELFDIRNAYEEIYSQLVPFSKNQLNFGVNESASITKSISDSISNSISESISKTQTTSFSKTKSESTTKGFNANIYLGIPFSSGKKGRGVGGGGGVGIDYNKTEGKSETVGNAEAEGYNEGSTRTQSRAHTESKGITEGRSQNIQLEFENKIIKNLMERIDIHLNRLNECEDLGVWNSCAYFITNDKQTNMIISGAYQSIMRGEDSYVSSGAINIWSDNDDKTKHKLKEINNYINKFHHPLFKIDSNTPLVSPSMLVSSLELSIQSGIPQKSVPGIPVIKYSTFAREILAYNNVDNSKSISIGKIFHLGNEEYNEVKLNVNSLCSHTFITGSTGSGKSNTVYRIISELMEKKIGFMVIESAKGEYKNIFGNKKDVRILGSNPYYTELLRINPFSFNKKIHVLEHIDRIIDVFNVCWPMYAAMPAILKESIEEAYKLSGWDLDLSTNAYDENLFPNFIDVLSCLKNIIDSSDFSQEVKSNYTGALVTRVKSLTNGITGRIFSSNEISDEELFNSNIIVDLSRIGSSETKSMIMGMLIIKLSEYRNSFSSMNEDLKHVTVLEEAHNILKRTSTEQNIEGANLIGKSVEMLSNSIAEMRTYGEGFIIADQSPSAVDISAIRNTNTKIILRLPEYSDREVVGKAASLNDSQIEELSKLQTGVAAIYQNNWIESVLCKIGHYSSEDIKNYENKDNDFFINKRNANNLLKYLISKSLNEKLDLNNEEILYTMNNSNIPTYLKLKIKKILENNEFNKDELSNIVYNVVDGDNILRIAKDSANNFENWINIIKSNIFMNSNDFNNRHIKEVINLILIESVKRENLKESYYKKWNEEFYKGDLL